MHPSLDSFQLLRVLNQDSRTKYIALLGTFSSNTSTNDELSSAEYSSVSQKAILLVERVPPTSETIKTLSVLTQIEQNDIYHWYKAICTSSPSSTNASNEYDVKIQVIHPATETHIRKYEKQEKMMISETPEMYHQKIKPWIESTQRGDRIQWVHNILSGKSEQSSILLSTPDMILLPDMKWDQTSLSSMYIQAIVKDVSLGCVRDLNGSHVDMLERIRDDAMSEIRKRYNVHDNQVRAYLHYLPSYYHLHIHFTHLAYEHPNAIIGQAILLNDVIDNLKLDGEYYQNRTMTYAIGKGSGVWNALFEGEDVSGNEMGTSTS